MAKRDSDYYRRRLEADHPDVFAALERGEYASVRAAAIAAGLVKDRTPLDDLRRAWKNASEEERQAFAGEVGGGSQVSDGRPRLEVLLDIWDALDKRSKAAFIILLGGVPDVRVDDDLDTGIGRHGRAFLTTDERAKWTAVAADADAPDTVGTLFLKPFPKPEEMPRFLGMTRWDWASLPRDLADFFGLAGAWDHWKREDVNMRRSISELAAADAERRETEAQTSNRRRKKA